MMNQNYMRLVSSMNRTAPIPTAYLVDDYSPVVAYSLRKLSSTITNVCRVRRVSDQAERDCTADEVTDGTLETWASGVAAYITKLYDQSGNGTDILNTTGSNQPNILDASGVLRTVDGVASMLMNNSKLSYSGAIFNQTDISFFSVASGTTSNANCGCLLATSSTLTTSHKIFIDRSSTKINLLIATGTNFFADLSVQRDNANSRLLSSFVDSSKNMSAFDNGATGGTATFTGSFTSDGIIVGQQASGFSKLAGYFSEIIGFNTDETSNRSAIETNINDYYSIY